MAMTDLLSLRSLLFLLLCICLFVDNLNAEDVAYTIEGSPSNSDSVIVLDGHNIYKRAASTDNSTDTNSAAAPTTQGPEVTTALPAVATTQVPTQAPPQTTAKPTTRKEVPTPGTDQPTTQETVEETTPPFAEIKEDNHKYYTVQVINKDEAFSQHWIEQKDAERHTTLSENYRVAVSIKLKFKARFYGNDIDRVTIATGGFLYMSKFLHKWLTATQYIAPLMANFDTTLGNGSEILYKDYGDKFVVEWSNVYLQDQNHTHPFLFQTHLLKNGTIKFVYKRMPIPIPLINKGNHPVKIGLSDAYYIDTVTNGKNRRTIYEYHRVEVDQSLIKDSTVVILHPIDTCNLLTRCDSCIGTKLTFDCKWCSKLKQCSDGMDWHRQKWRDNGCVTNAHADISLCGVNVTMTTEPSQTTQSATNVVPQQHGQSRACKGAGRGGCETKNDFSAGGIIAIVVILVLLIGGIAGWFVYAYANPQTPSGMWLMEHRPSQMKQKMAKMKFWKKNTPTGEKYRVESEA